MFTEHPRLLRRQILKGVAAIPLLQACSPKPGDGNEVIIEAMEGKPRLEPNRLERMLVALENTPVPFYRQIAGGLRLLATVTRRPPDLPEWVHPGSFPLQISYDDSNISRALMIMRTTDQADKAYFLYSPQRPPEKHYPVETVRVGIHLGQPKELLEQGLLAQALVLAKEYVSLMITMKGGEELFGLSSVLGFKVADQQGKDINDLRDQGKIGLSIIGAQLSNKSSQTWEVMDALPLYLVGFLIPYLIQQGIMGNSSKGLQAFMLASNKANSDPQLAQSLTNIIKSWTDAGTLLPPPGTTLKAFSSPIAPAVYDLQAQLRSMNSSRSK